jgi:hypothetical protein
MYIEISPKNGILQSLFRDITAADQKIFSLYLVEIKIGEWRNNPFSLRR